MEMINIPVANVINKTPEKVALTLSTMGSEIPLSHGWGGAGGDSTPLLEIPQGLLLTDFFTHIQRYTYREVQKKFGSLPSKLKILQIFERVLSTIMNIEPFLRFILFLTLVTRKSSSLQYLFFLEALGFPWSLILSFGLESIETLDGSSPSVFACQAFPPSQKHFGKILSKNSNSSSIITSVETSASRRTYSSTMSLQPWWNVALVTSTIASFVAKCLNSS